MSLTDWWREEYKIPATKKKKNAARGKKMLPGWPVRPVGEHLGQKREPTYPRGKEDRARGQRENKAKKLPGNLCRKELEGARRVYWGMEGREKKKKKNTEGDALLYDRSARPRKRAQKNKKKRRQATCMSQYARH